jgi:NADH-quinone oxidoreductase subunit C
MDPTTLIDTLQRAVPAAAVEPAPTADLRTTIYVAREAVEPASRALRDQPELAFTFLAELTAIDFWPREPRFELIYLLVSLSNRLRLRMKVRLHADDARVATVSSIWPAANWLEREVWDLFGIVFEGHPDLRRLLMPEDWDGYPLRKDYPVQIHKTPGYTQPLQVSEDEFRENLQRDRLARR